MFGKLLMTGLSPMVYTIWGSLDSDIFNLLIYVHVIWKRFCCYLVYHKRSAATNHSELTRSRQAVDWAVPQTEAEQDWGIHCRVEHLKRFVLYQLNVMLIGHQYNRKRKGQRNCERKEGKEKGNGNECFIVGFYCNAWHKHCWNYGRVSSARRTETEET